MISKGGLRESEFVHNMKSGTIGCVSFVSVLMCALKVPAVYVIVDDCLVLSCVFL